jgi:hypothetical protein
VQFFPVFFLFFNASDIISQDFGKNPTGKEPRDLKLEAEVISQKIFLRSDFIKKIMTLKNRFLLINS